MSQLKESDSINEIPEKKSPIGIEQPSSHRITSAPSTTCVSPVLEGKPLINHHLETLMLNCPNLNQQIAPNTNMGFGVNMGLGMNLNLGVLNDLNPANSFILPNQLYRTNNFIGNFHGIIPEYSSLLRNYNMNALQNSFPLVVGNHGIQLNNVSGFESLLLNQCLMSNSDEKQLENSLKSDKHSNIINPLTQSQLLAINSQPALIQSNIIPRFSPIITSCPGVLGQAGGNLIPSSIKPTFTGVQDKDALKSQKGRVLVDHTNERNSPEELEKLNNLIYSYINNINGLNDLNERVRNYLNTYNSDIDNRNNLDSVKMFGYVGGVADPNNNVKVDNIGKGNLSITSQRQVTTTVTENNVERNDIFKLNQTRKYRLGDQGRALLKSELSAYLRSNPDKRIEASKIADIRNATTKQLWQIAAMCGLEERFINLHAQSLAQSKGKMNVRGAKKRSNVNELSKLIGKNSYSTAKVNSKEPIELELFKVTSSETVSSNPKEGLVGTKSSSLMSNVDHSTENKLGDNTRSNMETNEMQSMSSGISKDQNEVHIDTNYYNRNNDGNPHSTKDGT
ncbi:hypothetical protein FG386_002663 [Cryptosporidium ryanae]|uniref:uncharacterized protein n=1 Tax=Cryptosporidium ryanae TaxID=515981 RepID=UPI00351A0DEC|nr:hypothetical protein FG386_002663 [Cryptosporidium ryanae]